MSFKKELETLINKHSIENKSNTPDYILAQYLMSCLDAFDEAILNRDIWFGRKTKPAKQETIHEQNL